MQTPLRGVNLGGWLVLERWMTPSLFAGIEAVDEYEFMQTPGALEKLEHHRKTWITEADFRWLHEQGITAIRVPVGYWVLTSDGPYQEARDCLDWAFAMAERYTLQVLLDLHGAPLSQNGHDHSGRVGEAGWFASSAAQERTLMVLEELHSRYQSSPSYWGIELLNEPKLGLFHRTLRRFYRQASRQLNGQQRIVFHDGFTPRLLSGALRGDSRAVMDVHLYHMTSWIAWGMSARHFVAVAGWWYGRLLGRVTRQQPVVIGEWSIVLAGHKVKNMPREESEALMAEFGQYQLAVYERTTIGWFYWSYKTEGRGIWNFRSLVEDGKLSLPS